jgi:transcriptional regulator NrdR family protein
MFRCPECQSENTSVYRTTHIEDATRRYHRCNECQHRFRTVQTYEDYASILRRIKWEVRNIPSD